MLCAPRRTRRVLPVVESGFRRGGRAANLPLDDAQVAPGEVLVPGLLVVLRAHDVERDPRDAGGGCVGPRAQVDVERVRVIDGGLRVVDRRAVMAEAIADPDVVRGLGNRSGRQRLAPPAYRLARRAVVVAQLPERDARVGVPLARRAEPQRLCRGLLRAALLELCGGRAADRERFRAGWGEGGEARFGCVTVGLGTGGSARWTYHHHLGVGQQLAKEVLAVRCAGVRRALERLLSALHLRRRHT